MTDHMLTCYVSDLSLDSGTCCIDIFGKSLKTLEAFEENRSVQMKKEFNNNPQITLNSYSKHAFFTAKKIKQIQLANMSLPAVPNGKIIIKALDTWNAEASGSEAMVQVPTKRLLLETSRLYDNPAKYFDFVNPYSPTLPVEQKFLDPKFCLPPYFIKKLTDTLEFNIHGSNDQSKPQVVHISPDDDLLKNVLARRKSMKARSKKRTKDQLEAYPLRTEFITKKRGGLKSLKYIKSRRDNGVCEVKASICKYSPQDVRDWIQGYCFKCNVRTPVDSFCPHCDNPTSISYNVKLTLKDEENEELEVYCKNRPLRQASAHEAHRSEAQFDKLKRIVHLAADTANVFFDFCVVTVDGQSCCRIWVRFT
ncbi:hypothetical protein INT47_003969 [Mucor saturninus]|uniref:Uncharacterized protein n=1 Tax=Mucor saturninus TaxID=64648 RepID=A0A8H7R9X6_9FUNG|nr:hypothetical protein INT47_003969 [Mucor saturninus]